MIPVSPLFEEARLELVYEGLMQKFKASKKTVDLSKDPKVKAYMKLSEKILMANRASLEEKRQLQLLFKEKVVRDYLQSVEIDAADSGLIGGAAGGAALGGAVGFLKGLGIAISSGLGSGIFGTGMTASVLASGVAGAIIGGAAVGIVGGLALKKLSKIISMYTLHGKVTKASSNQGISPQRIQIQQI